MIWRGWQTWRMIERARASGRWDLDKLTRWQEARLRSLLRHAYDNVPMYGRLFREAGFEPGMFRSLNDLKLIPVLSKSRLLEAEPHEVIARGIAPADCQVVRTSGSTGTPLMVYLGAREVCWHRAVAWRILFEHGFRWTDRTLEIRMTSGPMYALQRFGIAPKDWMSILESPASWARCLARRRHEVVVACSSSLHALAEAVESRGVEVRSPRLIISDSETLSPNTRRLVHRVLGTDPVDVFGLVEVSNFAWQCELRQGFHISAGSHIVEIGAPPGEAGPMVVTALGMWTMPIIRYETGDMAETDPRPCACGRRSPMISRLHGRFADAVMLPDGQRLYWPYFHEILAGYRELRRWQVVQDEPYRVKVKLVMRREAPGLTDRIRTDLRRALPPEMVLDIRPADDIPVPPGEKARAVISRVSSSGHPS